ncbi:MAG: ferredoxin-thioredoxin reductase, catalytic subunit [Promethearchaeota archaeon CR_4]|nr:MAG: ferredoxin-thioredoxin reductase, catalytic subunit [Candidatus Lokiarchaeota archaeon CR_4]
MSRKIKSYSDGLLFVTTTAQFKKWHLPHDAAFLKDLVEGLTTNYNRYGYFLCPCRDGTGVREKDKDIICPCTYCVSDQQDYGHCFCGLFLTPEFFAAGKSPQSIPERRPLDRILG